jgi:hypothetical protein
MKREPIKVGQGRGASWAGVTVQADLPETVAEFNTFWAARIKGCDPTTEAGQLLIHAQALKSFRIALQGPARDALPDATAVQKSVDGYVLGETVARAPRTMKLSRKLAAKTLGITGAKFDSWVEAMKAAGEKVEAVD